MFMTLKSNLEHVWFRQLSGTQERWTSPDPYLGSMDISNPQSLNRYGYVLNDPAGSVDPSGLVVNVPTALIDSFDGKTVLYEHFIDDGPELNFPRNFGGGGGGGGLRDFLGALLGGGLFGGGSIAGNCFLPGACPSIPVPSISIPGIPGLPPPGCDFGPCGNNLIPVFAGAGARTIGGTILCQLIEPCGAVEDVALIVVAVASLALLVHEFSKGGKQNIRPSWAEPFGLPGPNESGTDYATRVCREAGRDCGSGPGSDFEKLKKWADRRR